MDASLQITGALTMIPAVTPRLWRGELRPPMSSSIKWTESFTMPYVLVQSIILISNSESLVCTCRFIMIIPLSWDITDRRSTSLCSSWTSHARGVCRKIRRSLLGTGESLLPWRLITMDTRCLCLREMPFHTCYLCFFKVKCINS